MHIRSGKSSGSSEFCFCLERRYIRTHIFYRRFRILGVLPSVDRCSVDVLLFFQNFCRFFMFVDMFLSVQICIDMYRHLRICIYIYIYDIIPAGLTSLTSDTTPCHHAQAAYVQRIYIYIYIEAVHPVGGRWPFGRVRGSGA